MKSWKIGLSLFLLVFVIQSLIVPFVGMTWDEPSSFFFGRSTLKFYLTGDRGYLTDVKNPKRFAGDPFQYIYGEDVYPPFPFVVASATSYVFAEHAHLVSPITAHHLGLVFLGSLGVLAMFGIGMTLGWSPFVASLVALLYATYPTIVTQMRNDAKDVPLMSMIVIFVFMFLTYLRSLKLLNKQQFLWAIGMGVSLGLALASKPTAALMVPILGFWAIFSFLLFPKFRTMVMPLRRSLAGVFFAGSLAIISFFAAWPWLWDDPIGKLQTVWGFFRIVGRGMPTLYLGTIYNAGVNLPWHYPFGIFLFQTPPPLLLLGVFGVFGVFWEILKKRNPYPLLFVLWIVIGMGRFLLPGVLIYAKVRHFIDVLPAFFVVVGFGLTSISQIGQTGRIGPMRLIEKIRQLGRRGQIGLIVGGIALVYQLFIVATHVPYEASYFSFWVGGTKGAAQKELFDVEYWASGVAEAMRWIDKQTTSPVKVYACTMAHLALFYETPRVTVTSNPFAAQYTLVPNSASWFGGVRHFMDEHEKRVYTISRAGGDLFFVYKHVDGQRWVCGSETDMMYERP